MPISYVSFKTDLFFTDMPDEQRDSWFVGGDCAGWFYARLLPVDQVNPYIDPTMEDWGWIIGVKVFGLVVEISIWEDFNREQFWVFGISAKKPFLRRVDEDTLAVAEDLVVKAVGEILSADPRFSSIQWSSDQPLEAS